ncbi:hypothetical protein Ancab_002842 [Ancistrocladus abbreviatus]
MGTRVPVQNYAASSSELRSTNSYIGGSLHDLNTADSLPAAGDIDPISDVDHREAMADESLEHDEDSNAVDCMHEPYRNSIQLHGVGVEDDRSSLESNSSLRRSYDSLTINDVSPIETARARFLQIIVDNFINEHVIELSYSQAEYSSQPGEEKLNKRKSEDVQYEGDPGFALPLMYVANMYETLVHEVNLRLASLNGFREKTIGVALEAAGGLYRMLAKKFPRKGPCTFRRRELATSLETRTRFPELVIQEEKRVRFVVVNGLDIAEKPNSVPVDDAEWFKRLTGRNEVTISAQDYKFYSPRHKYRRVLSNPLTNVPGLPSYPGADNSSPLSSPPGFHPMTEKPWQMLMLPFHVAEPKSADTSQASYAAVDPSTAVSLCSPITSPEPTGNPFLTPSAMWAAFTLARHFSCSSVTVHSPSGIFIAATGWKSFGRPFAYAANKPCKVL